MKILMLSSTFPYPPTRGGTQGRTFHLLKSLAHKHSVTLVTQYSQDVTDEEIEALRSWVDELVIFPRPEAAETGIPAKLKRLFQFWQEGTPPNVKYLYSEAIQGWVNAAITAQKFDVLTCEHSVNEVYVKPEWRRQLWTVINIHSSITRTCKNQLETKTSENQWRDRFYLPLLSRYEEQMVRKFSSVVVTSDEDKQQIKSCVPAAEVAIIPNGVALEMFPYRAHDPGEHSLVFVGGLDYSVNVDAACFFALKVLPKLQVKYPDTTLTLVGANPTSEVLALGELPGVTVTGRVPSIAPYLHQATVSVVPLRTGFGMKIKTLESMAAGVPVVGSDRGLEGLDVDSPDVPLCALRANTVEEYGEAVSRLFEEAQLREELSRNGRSLIEKQYTWEQMGALYEQVLAGKWEQD